MSAPDVERALEFLNAVWHHPAVADTDARRWTRMACEALRPGWQSPTVAAPQTGWLDPEPEHAEHDEVTCRGLLPKPRSVDEGRRFRCAVCGRTYRVEDWGQRDGMGWGRL